MCTTGGAPVLGEALTASIPHWLSMALGQAPFAGSDPALGTVKDENSRRPGGQAWGQEGSGVGGRD